MFLNMVNSNNCNQSENDINSIKAFSDNYAICRDKINKEKNPLKKQKMETRLALGIVDFSDL